MLRYTFVWNEIEGVFVYCWICDKPVNDINDWCWVSSWTLKDATYPCLAAPRFKEKLHYVEDKKQHWPAACFPISLILLIWSVVHNSGHFICDFGLVLPSERTNEAAVHCEPVWISTFQISSVWDAITSVVGCRFGCGEASTRPVQILGSWVRFNEGKADVDPDVEML